MPIFPNNSGHTKYNVPFYSQKWNLHDWKRLGFKSYKDAQYWEVSSCGILCLKMATDAFLSSRSEPLSPSVASIIKLGVEINAYDKDAGWRHEGIVRLADKLGFSAYTQNPVKNMELCQLLRDGDLAIVSVKSAFRTKKSPKEKILFWRKYGGHLALVIGYKEDESGKLEGFYIHHTSAVHENNWPKKLIPLKVFNQGFTRRAVIIKRSS